MRQWCEDTLLQKDYRVMPRRFQIGNKRLFSKRKVALAMLSLWVCTAAAKPVVVSLDEPDSAKLQSLPYYVGGRAIDGPAKSGITRQWPGTYMETSVRGESVLFRIGVGDVRLHVLVDGRIIDTLVKPEPGLYRIGELSGGEHRIRLEVASESQAEPTQFGGFFSDGHAHAMAISRPRRQIEFIGDSHTVGYANLSATLDCSDSEVWSATDSSLGFGPQLAKAIGADYRINAISGRGVVRNYNGFDADTLPESYDNVLFEIKAAALAQVWKPQVVVIGLGTNDFSTPLNAGERWQDRAALHADYEEAYVTFVKTLRGRYPNSFFVLWATDMADGEIEAEVSRVVTKLNEGGDPSIAFVAIHDLALSACHGHPTTADDQVIAGKIGATISARPRVWSD